MAPTDGIEFEKYVSYPAPDGKLFVFFAGPFRTGSVPFGWPALSSSHSRWPQYV